MTKVIECPINRGKCKKNYHFRIFEDRGLKWSSNLHLIIILIWWSFGVSISQRKKMIVFFAYSQNFKISATSGYPASQNDFWSTQIPWYKKFKHLFRIRRLRGKRLKQSRSCICCQFCTVGQKAQLLHYFEMSNIVSVDWWIETRGHCFYARHIKFGV